MNDKLFQSSTTYYCDFSRACMHVDQSFAYILANNLYIYINIYINEVCCVGRVEIQIEI